MSASLHRLAPPHRVSKEQAALLLLAEAVLDDLTYEEARELMNHMRPQRLAPGATLIREGDTTRAPGLCLVLEGSVELRSQSGEGPAQVLAVLGPGALLGEASLVDDQPPRYSCTALDHVGLACLSRNSMQTLMAQRPELAARLALCLLRRLSRRFEAQRQRLGVLRQLLRLTALKSPPINPP